MNALFFLAHWVHSRVGGKVRGWAKLGTCLMGNVLLISWRSFANPRRYPTGGTTIPVHGQLTIQ